MSDWEDEYNEDGVAIQKPAPKSAPTEWKLPCEDRPRENGNFGVRSGARFGAPREWRADRSGEGSESRGPRGGGEGRPFPRSTGPRRTFGDEKLDSSPPVTVTVESASIGRVIGGFLVQKFQFKAKVNDFAVS